MKHRVVDSPVGEYVIVVDEGDAVTGIYHRGQDGLPLDVGERDDTVAETAAHQLEQYFAGTRHAFDFPMNPHGTDFQQAVWRAIAAIPPGHLRTYGEIAAELGSSARAVGGATGRNPISIAIPCHRVVSTGGAITGYAGGLEVKEWLLRHEGYRITPARGTEPAARAARVTPAGQS